MSKPEKLTAEKLKSLLWEALHDVRAGVITPQQGDAIARHSREIVRIHMAQITTLNQVAAATPEMMDFADPDHTAKRKET